MTIDRQSVEQVLKQFPVDWTDYRMEHLGNHGGYSGAQLHKVYCADQTYCLRQWPVKAAQTERIEWIHQVVRQVVEQGFPAHLLPTPIINCTRSTLTIKNGMPFELSLWLPGIADFGTSPTTSRTHSAATLLATFHECARKLGYQQIDGSELKGVKQRKTLISELKLGLLKTIETRIDRLPFADLARSIIFAFHELEPTISRNLNRISSYRFEKQICIRDIWHDHLLFQGNEVSGIVDFGALDFDHFGTDIARLFGSLFGNDHDQWNLGIESYRSIRELSDLELELIEVYDRSTTMLAGMNWLKWILVENRKFDSYLPIIKRIELLAQRMRDWI